MCNCTYAITYRTFSFPWIRLTSFCEILPQPPKKASGLSSSLTEGSLSLLVEESFNDDEEEEATPIATPDVSQGRKAQLSSLDSLLDDQGSSWNSNNSTSTFNNLSNRAKSNSLPKSAFGTLQLKGHYFGLRFASASLLFILLGGDFNSMTF